MRMLRILGSIIILFSLAACDVVVKPYPKQLKAIESFCQGHIGFVRVWHNFWDGNYTVQCKDKQIFKVPRSIRDMRE